MPATTKLVKVYGLLHKLETSYNAGGSTSPTTDGVLLEELGKLSLKYANDGMRPAPPGTMGYQRKDVPTGRYGEWTAKVAPKGAGAAYSSTVVPNVHTLLRAAGFDGAVTTTAGSEKWAYTPTPGPTGFGSGVASLYGRGELYPFTGWLSDFEYTIDGPNVPVMNFAAKGILGAITDVAAPAITYPALTIDPAKAVGVAFTLGNLTAGIVRKLSIKLQRTLDMRLDINAAGGFQGWTPSGRKPVMEVELESLPLTGAPYTAASAIDPYNLFDAASNLAWSFTVGSVQYNRHSVSGPGCQLMAPPELDNDGGTAITKLSLQLNPSSWGANDELSLSFN